QTVGIVDQTGMEVLIYPNPAQEHFMIEVVGSNKDENYELKIIDSRGRVVHEKSFEKILKVESRNLSDGIYLLHLKNNFDIVQRKILISDLK
ncbi:MAG: T9SS type A sorting domain-containing protein, partial [Bacteroidota bacterium]|nr:T9SS type A sorting domain-containing protein [Bacteroidota bacterium]